MLREVGLFSRVLNTENRRTSNFKMGKSQGMYKKLIGGQSQDCNTSSNTIPPKSVLRQESGCCSVSAHLGVRAKHYLSSSL